MKILNGLQNKNNTVTLCGIFKNEGRYVKEWLIYHYLIGINKFLVYLNDNTDSSIETILSLSFRDKIDIIEFSGKVNQQKIYTESIKNLCNTDWFVGLDIDEFLFIKQEDTIQNYLSREIFNGCGGIALFQNVFGHSNHVVRPNGLVIENYLHINIDYPHFNKQYKFNRSPDDLFKFNKVIVRVKDFISTEKLRLYKTTNPVVIESGEVFIPHRYQRSVDNIVINHYFTKSLEDWNFKTGRPWVGDIGSYDDLFFNYPEYSRLFDDTMVNKFVHKIKSFI
jgi:hypothetical protein